MPNKATMPTPCQVRSRTESPCPHPAVAEIRGVAFCGLCAREQEAYFAIGELVAREEERGHRAKLLVEALRRLRRESAGGEDGIPAETHLGRLRNRASRAQGQLTATNRIRRNPLPHSGGD